jgi:hypothetical protein
MECASRRARIAEVSEEFVAEGGVEAVEGFVEQEKAAVGSDGGAGNGDALLLAAGEERWLAVGDRREVEALHCMIEGLRSRNFDFGGVGQVFAHGHVGEESGTLRGPADWAFVRGTEIPVAVCDRRRVLSAGG